MTDRLYTELPDKDPEDFLDYEIDFAEFIPSTYSLDNVQVEIEDAGNGESPLELSVSNVAAAPGCGGVSRPTAVLFWLGGGSNKVRYKGKISVSDNASSSPDRVLIHRFYIMISK